MTLTNNTNNKNNIEFGWINFNNFIKLVDMKNILKTVI